MSMQDPIADALTQMRNAIRVKKPKVVIYHSNIVEKILQKMQEEKYIEKYVVRKVKDKPSFKEIEISLKYVKNVSVISDLKRISKPSLRHYVKSTEVPKVLNGLGLAILSTPKGILSGHEAKEQKVGGEVIAYVW